MSERSSFAGKPGHSGVARWETGSTRPRGLAHRFVLLWIANALGEEVSLGS